MPNDTKTEKKKVESEEREIQERTRPGSHAQYIGGGEGKAA